MTNLKAYLVFADRHFAEHGFRCNMPLGSYFIRQDTHSLLSYSYDGDIISIDPIHAPGDHDRDEVGGLPERVQWLGAPAGREPPLEPEPIRHEGARGVGLW